MTAPTARPLTEAELEAIEALLAKLASGPWAVTSHQVGRDPVFTIEGAPALCGHRDCTTPHAPVLAHDIGEDLAAFIAAARTDVPALVAEVRRLRAIEQAAEAFDGATIEMVYGGAVYTRGPYNAASLYGRLRELLRKETMR